MENFQVGDVVVLNSGSPKMTVKMISDSAEVICEWFENTTKRSSRFLAETIKKYNSPLPGTARHFKRFDNVCIDVAGTSTYA